MSLRDELLAVRAQYGSLTPRNVVEAARENREAFPTVYSRVFSLDDVEAAEAHRLDLARQLIREIKIVYRDPKGERKTVREYYPIRDEQSPTTVFSPIGEILTDEIQTRIVMADMRREWAALKRRYERFDEFRKMVLGDLGEATG